MKILLLILFLALSLGLPLWMAFVNRERGMLVSIAQGVLIYLLSTVLNNFFSRMVGLESLELPDDRKIYAVLMTLSLTIAVGIFALLKVYRDERKSCLIYVGFSLVNTFIYNTNSYGILLYIAANHSEEKLSGLYPAETARELLAHYDGISVSELLLLNVELLFSFFILGMLIRAICQKGRKAFDYLLFVVALFLFFGTQYCIGNRLIGFTVYVILLLVGYRDKIKGAKAKLSRRENGDRSGDEKSKL